MHVPTTLALLYVPCWSFFGCSALFALSRELVGLQFNAKKRFIAFLDGEFCSDLAQTVKDWLSANVPECGSFEVVLFFVLSLLGIMSWDRSCKLALSCSEVVPTWLRNRLCKVVHGGNAISVR